MSVVLQAAFLQGRWLATCPRCESLHTVEGETLVCSVCWKGMRAQKFQQDKFGALISVPHVEQIFETRDQARAAGEEYIIQYPENMNDILTVLRQRPIQNMGWVPGETIEQLIQENTDHGLESGL